MPAHPEGGDRRPRSPPRARRRCGPAPPRPARRALRPGPGPVSTRPAAAPGRRRRRGRPAARRARRARPRPVRRAGSRPAPAPARCPAARPPGCRPGRPPPPGRSSTRALAAVYSAIVECQSRWSSAMLSTTPASGRSDGAQYSWKLDSSTASRSAGCSSTSSTGLADVAAQHAAQARGGQHGVQHRRRRRLAVGAGHHQPAPRRPVVARGVQPPGQLHVAPDGHARRRGGGQHRASSAGNRGW